MKQLVNVYQTFEVITFDFICYLYVSNTDCLESKDSEIIQCTNYATLTQLYAGVQFIITSHADHVKGKLKSST